MKTPFLGGSYLSRSPDLNAQRCVNLFAEMTEGGRDVGAFFNTPGLTPWVDLGTSFPIVGGIVAGGYLWVVSDSTLFKVATNGVVVNVGVVTSSGRVTMAFNGTQIVIATGSTGRIVTVATSAIANIASNYPTGAQTVAVIDGYFIVEKPGTQLFYQSDLQNGTTWNALAFGSKEGAPDDLVAVIADHRELWLFGEDTIEVWYNAGTSPLAFSRVDGAFNEHGVVSPYSIGRVENAVFWISQDRNGGTAVFGTADYRPERISTPAIEFAMSGYELTDAFTWTYQQEGHSFICFTFPTASKTWCFDVSTKLWHERAGLDSDGFFIRHKANCAFQFAGKTIVGDYLVGKLYDMNLDEITDDSATIKRLRAWGHIHNNGDRIRINELQLIASTGSPSLANAYVDVGEYYDDGYYVEGYMDGPSDYPNPQAMLRWSDDGGHTWSNEHWASLGEVGEYRRRVVWRRLGTTRDRVFELSVTDQVKIAWIGAEIDAMALR